MQNKEDGGPAFPEPPIANELGVFSSTKPGMSLRDYFAGQALTGFLTGVQNINLIEAFAEKMHCPPQKAIAILAYDMADKMLEERVIK